MVRTYGNNQQRRNFQLVSPWEQAMRNVDQENGIPIVTGKRMFNKNNVAQTSYDFQHNKQSKLPPLNNEMPDILSQFEHEIGNILMRSPERLENMQKEIQLYDPTDTGIIGKSAVIEILKRYKIPKNEKSQKNIVACFISKEGPSKIDRFELIDYLENCRDKAVDQKKNGSRNTSEPPRQIKIDIPQTKTLNDSTHGRYDSEPTTEGMPNKNGKFGRGSKEIFVEKRDAGLILEIERAFKASRISDPHLLIDRLAEKLESTCRNDEMMSDNMHVKCLVDKSEFPLNSALTLKCIDRLDTQDLGRIEWPRFIEFLRKGAASFSRTENNTPSISSTSSNGYYKKLPPKQYTPNGNPQTPIATPETIPEKPYWEARTPLTNIPQKNQVRKETEFKPQEASTDRQLKHKKNRQNQEKENANETYVLDDRGAPPSTASELNNDNSRMIDDDYEDPFLQYANEYNDDPNQNNNHTRDHFDNSYNQNYGNYLRTPSNDMPHGLDFSVMGERGESFKRVTDALIEKARRTNDIITTLDVERIINYYNLLFDTAIPMQQVEKVLNKYASQGRIDVERLVGTFGTEIE